jgi:hypothetical protein
MIIAIKAVIGALVGVEGKVNLRHEVNTIHDFANHCWAGFGKKNADFRKFIK